MCKALCMSEPELLTSFEVANRLGVSRMTVLRWVDSGYLQAVTRLPGKTGAWLFSAEEIEHLSGHEKSPADAHTDSESGAVA